MIEVKCCPLCGSKRSHHLMTQSFPDRYLSLINEKLNSITRKYNFCDDCGLIYRNPKLSAQEQKLLYLKYREVSFRQETPNEYFDRISGYPIHQSENYSKFKWTLDNLNQPLGKSPKILDVGCGGGVLLKRIKEMVPDAVTFGVEPNPVYSDLARSRSGAKSVITGYFSSDLFEEQFDLVTSSDVLEHVDDPLKFLCELKKTIKPGGGLFIEIPSEKNFDVLDDSHDMFNIAHHVFYTEKNLYELLDRLEFKSLTMDSVEYLSGVWKTRVLGKK